MFNKILLASDGSNNSLRACDRAIEMAKCKVDSIIEVVYVIDLNTSKQEALHHMDAGVIQLEREQRMQLTVEKIKASGVNSNTTILHGEPGPTLVKYANDQDFDLVVIGSRGLNSLQEMVLGSVSHKVAKRVQCPVMIVK